MKPRSARGWLLALVCTAAACGRSNLLTGDDGQGKLVSGPVAEGCVALADVDGDADLDCVAHTSYGGSQKMFGLQREVT